MTEGGWRAAFQGELGAFGEEAIAQLWGASAEPFPRRSFRDVVAAVASGEADRAVLPVENTLAGSVIDVYDALAAQPALHVVAETVVRVRHCLLAPPGATLAGVRTVASHAVALAQCTNFLAAHPYIEARAVYDTAGAAADVSARRDPTAAAIAGRTAASRYGLEILAADIEDRPDNQTRFWAVARETAPLSADGAARTALELTTDNVPGALLRVLTPLAEREVNLTKLESRPTGEPWRYRFFLEMEHDSPDPSAIRDVIDAVARVSRTVRVLGTYSRAVDVATTSPSPGTSPATLQATPTAGSTTP